MPPGNRQAKTLRARRGSSVPLSRSRSVRSCRKGQSSAGRRPQRKAELLTNRAHFPEPEYRSERHRPERRSLRLGPGQFTSDDTILFVGQTDMAEKLINQALVPSCADDQLCRHIDNRCWEIRNQLRGDHHVDVEHPPYPRAWLPCSYGFATRYSLISSKRRYRDGS